MLGEEARQKYIKAKKALRISNLISNINLTWNLYWMFYSLIWARKPGWALFSLFFIILGIYMKYYIHARRLQINLLLNGE